MKVNQNISVYAGNDSTIQERKSEQNPHSKSLFAGNMNGNAPMQDMIALKKQQAQKKAFKVVSDAWSGDRAIDEAMELHRDKARQLSDEKHVEEGFIKDIREHEKQMQAFYGVEDDSQEQKDALLLCKEQEGEELTGEEMERVSELYENGLTEYQSNLLEMNEGVAGHKKAVSRLEGEIEQENATVQAMRLERLKHDPMLKAQQQADAIEEAAGKEILGMLFEEGKENIDEEQEVRTDQAEEIKEKREEQEELIEKRKEKQEETEELMEEILTGDVAGTGRSISEVQQEVKNIVKQMKLVEDDIKGAKVDETL